MILMFPLVTVVNAEPLISGGLGIDYSTEMDDTSSSNAETNLRLTVHNDFLHVDVDINDGATLKRTYLNYSPIPEMQLRVGNIRVNSGLASHTGYAAQTFVSQVEGFTRSHRLGIAAVGDYKEIGYQFAVFKDNSYLGRLTADVTDYLTLGFHYHSENDRYGLERQQQLTSSRCRVNYLAATNGMLNGYTNTIHCQGLVIDIPA